MIFIHPILLLFLIIPVLLASWEWQQKGHLLILPFDHGQQKSGKFLDYFITSANLLPYFLLASAICLLAGPQRLAKPVEERIMTNIEFCVDVSGSMTSPFGEGTRYDGAMKAIDEFTNHRKGDAFGLTVFGNEVLHWVPLSKDLSAIRKATPFLRPEKMPPWFGGTQIGKALRSCRKVLTSRPQGDRMIILLTDGASADLHSGQAEAVAQELSEDQIVVHTVYVAEGDAPEDMFTISGLTRGGVFAAADNGGLKEVFRKIDAMHPIQLQPGTPEYSDLFWPFALAGLSFTGMHVLCLFGLRYMPW